MKIRCLFLLVLLAFTFSISASAQTPRYACVISQNANLRDTPSVSGVSEQEVAEDTIVKVLDEKLPWYVVRVGNHVGWMHGNTIEFIGTQGSVPEPAHQQTVVPDYKPTPAVPSRDRAPEGSVRTSGENRGYIRGPRGGCYYFSGSRT